MLVLGWNRFWGRELEFVQTKLIGFLILAVSLPPLLDLVVGKRWLHGALIAAGGYLGTEIDRGATVNLNRTGAAILMVTAALVGLLLTTRISLAAVWLEAEQGGGWGDCVGGAESASGGLQHHGQVSAQEHHRF